MISHPRTPARSVEVGRPISGLQESTCLFEDVNRLAQLVKRIYVLERRLHESVLTRKPSRYLPRDERHPGAISPELTRPRHSVWENVAQFLAEQQIGPIDYIARQFDQYASLSKPLFPTCLLGEAAWQRYTDSKTTKRQDLAHRLRGYMSRWGSSSSCSFGIDWQERPGRNAAVEDRLSVLYCDESLPPLFVFCAGMLLAREHRAYADESEDWARRYEVEAAVEYIRFRRDYDAVWQRLVPHGFRERAEDIYRRVLSRIL